MSVLTTQLLEKDKWLLVGLIQEGFVEVASDLELKGLVKVHHQVLQKRIFLMKVHNLCKGLGPVLKLQVSAELSHTYHIFWIYSVVLYASFGLCMQ